MEISYDLQIDYLCHVDAISLLELKGLLWNCEQSVFVIVLLSICLCVHVEEEAERLDAEGCQKSMWISASVENRSPQGV